MARITNPFIRRLFLSPFAKKILLFLGVFGPATITAMADNDASGVATLSLAGATLGYPILFIFLITTPLLAITQEMGMRLALVTRRGLADLIREQFGVRASLTIFAALVVANLGTVTVELAAIKTTSTMLNIPAIPFLILMIIISFLVVTKGNYKITQGIMLLVSLFYVAYVISAIKAKPDWGMAVTNLFVPHGVDFTPAYIRQYLIIGMGVVGTMITPWGQFFISSFAFDKNIEAGKVVYAQVETYVGSFLTHFISFFLVVATAATLFINKITLTSGEQAALAIEPFTGKFASVLFAVGLLNAGFIGLVVVSLSTAYAFSEFFGHSGSLDSNFKQSKSFYWIYIVQILIAGSIAILPGVSLFKLAILTQTINALALPLVFYFLIRLTNNKSLMGGFVNSRFQKWFAVIGSVLIFIASVFALSANFFKF
jgi:Mn2+/Fe2+ NRAMP family transporter